MEKKRTAEMEVAQEKDETTKESLEDAPEVTPGVWGSGILAGSSYAL